MISTRTICYLTDLHWCGGMQAAQIIRDVNVGTAKVKIGNKIGKKPTGVHRDFAMTLQKGLREIRLGGELVVRWTDERGTRHLVQAHEPEMFAKVVRTLHAPQQSIALVNIPSNVAFFAQSRSFYLPFFFFLSFSIFPSYF